MGENSPLDLSPITHPLPTVGSAEEWCWFESLFEVHHAALRAYVYGYLASYEAAEDVIQDLFVSVWGNRDAWRRRDDRMPAALYVAARNRALDLLKHQRVRRRHSSMTSPRSWVEPVAQDELLYEELKAQVDAAIAALPERSGLVFTLSREGGLTYAEIADLLGLSTKTVENQMSRALRTLRSELIPLLLSCPPMLFASGFVSG